MCYQSQRVVTTVHLKSDQTSTVHFDRACREREREVRGKKTQGSSRIVERWIRPSSTRPYNGFAHITGINYPIGSDAGMTAKHQTCGDLIYSRGNERIVANHRPARTWLNPCSICGAGISTPELRRWQKLLCDTWTSKHRGTRTCSGESALPQRPLGLSRAPRFFSRAPSARPRTGAAAGGAP